LEVGGGGRCERDALRDGDVALGASPHREAALLEVCEGVAAAGVGDGLRIGVRTVKDDEPGARDGAAGLGRKVLGVWAEIHQRRWEISGDSAALDTAVNAYQKAFSLIIKIKVELHAHTADDSVDVIPHTTNDLIDRAAALGYDAVAITLHDRQLDLGPWLSYAANRRIVLIPGHRAHN